MTQPMTITIRIKDVYGKETIYPVCETAKTFAAIAGTTTLTGVTLMRINSLGYTILTEERKL